MATTKAIASSSTIQPERDEFIRLAMNATESTSRFEDKLIDTALESLCRNALDRGDDSDIEAALTELKTEEMTPAYEELLSMAEDCAQSLNDKRGSHILVMIPILAWSRYQIPFGKINEKALKSVANIYRKHLASDEASIIIGDSLICAEHIPEGLAQVHDLLKTLLGRSIRHGKIVSTAHLLNQTPPNDVSDCRYLIAAVSAPTVQGLFLDQGIAFEERARRYMNFAKDCEEALADALIGCVYSVQPPAGFFTAWRQNETAMRVYALKSMVDFVGCMNFVPEDLIATTAVFVRAVESATEPNVEIRIGISSKSAPNAIISGVIWPCLNDDPEGNQAFAADVLTSCGINSIFALNQTFPMEYCEDCGAPLYANPSGLVVHLELPEGVNENLVSPTLN